MWVQVLQVRDIGAVVELPGGHDALVHISEMSMEPVEKTQDAVAVGDFVDVFILSSTANSTRASIAALERIKQGLPAVVERKRRSSSNGGGRGGHNNGRGRYGGPGTNGDRRRRRQDSDLRSDGGKPERPSTPEQVAMPLQTKPNRGSQP